MSKIQCRPASMHCKIETRSNQSQCNLCGMQREVGLDFADKRIMAVLAIILKQPQELVVAHHALKYAKGNNCSGKRTSRIAFTAINQ